MRAAMRATVPYIATKNCGQNFVKVKLRDIEIVFSFSPDIMRAIYHGVYKSLRDLSHGRPNHKVKATC